MSSIAFDLERRNLVLEFKGKRITLGPFVGPAQGEANNGANVGGGAEVFRDKAGATLNFRTIVGPGVVENADTITVTGHLGWLQDEFTPTLGQVTFIITQPPADLVSLEFYVNGALYDDVVDYVVSGGTVTWTNLFILDPEDLVTIRYQ